MLSLIAMMLAGTAVGPNWTLVNAVKDAKVYVDLSTIKAQGANKKTAWVRWQYSPLWDNTAYRILKQNFDCQEEASGIASYSEYDVNGNPLETGTRKASEVEMQPTAPGTIGQMVLNRVCQG